MKYNYRTNTHQGSCDQPEKTIGKGESMVTAFVLINVENKSYQKLVDQLNELDGVEEVHLVAGEYDMVAVVKVKSNEELSRLLTDNITHIPGIRHTKTLISLRS